MKFARGKENQIILLAAILIAALLLRLWGVWFGLPYIYHFDEHFYVSTALKIGKGIFFNDPFAPVGLANLLFVEYAIYFIFSLISGGAASPAAFETAYLQNPAPFFLIARLTSLVVGTLTVALVYQLGSTVYNRRVGLVAAIFLAVDALHVRDSHFGVPDISMTFFVAAAVLLLLHSLKKQNLSLLMLGGLLAGVAISMKWTALPIAVVAAAAGFLFPVDQDSRGSRSISLIRRPLLLALGGVIAGFAISSPQILANPFPYIAEAFGQAGSGGDGGFDWWEVDTLPGWLFYLKILFFGNGLLLWLAGLSGALLSCWQVITRGGRERILLLLFPFLYFLLMGSTRHYFARYALPMLPFWMIFAAVPVLHVADRVINGRWNRAILLWACLLLIIAQPLSNALRSDWIMTRQDTRTEAKQWIETHIPAGARIALEWETHTPPLSSPEMPSPESKRSYDLVIVKGIGLSENPLEWYQEEEFDYLITTSFIARIPLLDDEADQLRTEFYRSLVANFEQVAEFRPAQEDVPFMFDEIYGPLISQWAREQPGPVLRIYQVRR